MQGQKQYACQSSWNLHTLVAAAIQSIFALYLSSQFCLTDTTYAVGVLMGGLEGRVPFGCPSKHLILVGCVRRQSRRTQPTKAKFGGGEAAPKPPPRNSCNWEDGASRLASILL